MIHASSTTKKQSLGYKTKCIPLKVFGHPRWALCVLTALFRYGATAGKTTAAGMYAVIDTMRVVVIGGKRKCADA